MPSLPFISDKKKKQMVQGAELYLNWYRDVLAQGLQYLEHQPDLIESIATQLVDAGNSSMARQIRIAANSMIDTPPEEWIGLLTDQAIIAKCLVNIDQFPPLEQLDILHHAGLQQRQKELKQQQEFNDLWTVLAVQTQKLEQLTERKVYLQSHSKGKIALLLDYAFRSNIFEQKWPVGKVYKAKLKFFPSSVPLRAKVLLRKRSFDSCSWKGVSGLAKWHAFRQKQINAHPWLFSYPALLMNLQLAKADGVWSLRDNQSPYFLNIKEVEDAQRILTYSLGKPFHCFGVWDKGNFQLLSFIKEEHIIQLQSSIWTQ